jgi:hypothetical protein
VKKQLDPKGRKKLAPDISFVVRNIVLLQKGEIFFLKGQLLVMLFLLRDVSGNGRHIRFANAESAISRLPGKLHIPFLMNPARGICFDNAGDFRHRVHGTNANQHVDVIGGSIHDKSGAVHFANDAAQICEQIITGFQA